MKWLIALAIIVAGAVSAFAVYTFGWRDSDSSDSERTRAVAFAQEIEGVTEDFELDGIARVSSGLWRARFWQSGGGPTCLQIHLDRFVVQSDSEGQGVSRVTCRGVEYDSVGVSEP